MRGDRKGTHMSKVNLLTVLRDSRYIGQEAMRNRAADDIERLQERCTAYKGQVEAGALEIERLAGEVAMLRATNERLTGVLRDAGLLQAYQQSGETK
jgi:predicted metal-dependent hydrolase